MKTIAVIDLAVSEVFIYHVPVHFKYVEIEFFLIDNHHHLSNCSWGEFNGTINHIN